MLMLVKIGIPISLIYLFLIKLLKTIGSFLILNLNIEPIKFTFLPENMLKWKGTPKGDERQKKKYSDHYKINAFTKI